MATLHIEVTVMGTETKTYGKGKATGGNAAPNGRDGSAELRGADRRRCERLSLTFPIEVSGADATGRPFSDRTITSDVSEEGCRFELLRVFAAATWSPSAWWGDRAMMSATPALRFEIVWVETSDNGWASVQASFSREYLAHDLP